MCLGAVGMEGEAVGGGSVWLGESDEEGESWNYFLLYVGPT